MRDPIIQWSNLRRVTYVLLLSSCAQVLLAPIGDIIPRTFAETIAWLFVIIIGLLLTGTLIGEVSLGWVRGCECVRTRA